jgi:hypothetical protein
MVNIVWPTGTVNLLVISIKMCGKLLTLDKSWQIGSVEYEEDQSKCRALLNPTHKVDW